MNSTPENIVTGSADDGAASKPSRAQHIVPASLVLMLALSVAWLSFTREPAGAFLFPRLISAVMLVLAGWNFLRAASGKARVGNGLEWPAFLNILPGLVLMALYIFVAAKMLGFYVASFGAFFLLFSLYDLLHMGIGVVGSSVCWLQSVS